MGDRNQNKDEEIDLDGVGGVSIVVKADVHRSGKRKMKKQPVNSTNWYANWCNRHQLPLLRL